MRSIDVGNEKQVEVDAEVDETRVILPAPSHDFFVCGGHHGK